MIFSRCRGWLARHRLAELPEEVAAPSNVAAALRLSTPSFTLNAEEVFARFEITGQGLQGHAVTPYHV